MMKLSLLLSLLLVVAVGADPPRRLINSVATQSRSFINVAGPNLKARWETAIKQGGAQSQRFWAAYGFDVRSGIAFDTVIFGAGGARITINGASVSPNFTSSNVGVFLLHESGGRAIVRAEIYNLETRREYAGYPVYWLGRGGNEESLSLLRGLLATVRSSEGAERITDAIGAHDDPSVAIILKDLIRSSTVQKVRTTAVSWLGHLPGESAFLSALVRDEREHVEVRKEAADALGDSQDSDVLTVLQTLYRAVIQREVKRELLDAISDERFEATAVNFLIEIAGREPDRELRKEAIESLGERDDARSLQALEKIVNDASVGSELQRTAVEAIGARPEDEALPRLKQIAKTHPAADVRREAIERLGELPGQMPFLVELARSEGENLELRKQAVEAIAESQSAETLNTLKQLYARVANREVKQEIIGSFEDCGDRQAAIDFLTTVARTDADREARKQAFETLGNLNDERATDALAQLHDAERDEALKEELLSALAEAEDKRALKKLIAVAKSDPSVKLRKKAIELLGESDDPEAVKFLEGLIK